MAAAPIRLVAPCAAPGWSASRPVVVVEGPCPACCCAARSGRCGRAARPAARPDTLTTTSDPPPTSTPQDVLTDATMGSSTSRLSQQQHADVLGSRREAEELRYARLIQLELARRRDASGGPPAARLCFAADLAPGLAPSATGSTSTLPSRAATSGRTGARPSSGRARSRFTGQRAASLAGRSSNSQLPARRRDPLQSSDRH